MSDLDWNRWNKPRTQWPDTGYGWNDRHTVPHDLGPHAGKKAVMVLLSPLFAGAAMVAAVALNDPAAAKDMFRRTLHMDRNSSDAMRTTQQPKANP